jgi:hypothetical protein
MNHTAMADQDKKPTASSASDGQSKNKRWKKKRTGKKSVVQPANFRGGKEELDGNYFDCTGYGQLDRFMKTVQKIVDHIGQEYRVGGVTRTEVMTQAVVIIPAPARPMGTRVAAADGAVTITPPPRMSSTSVIIRMPRRLSIIRFNIRPTTARQYYFLSGNSVPNRCMPRSRPIATAQQLNRHLTESIY